MDAVSTPELKSVPKPATADDYYINVKNKSNLSFKEMWNRADLSDIKLCCDKDEFRLHRFLLAACSPYFKRLFEKRPNSNQSIVLEDVNGDDLRRVLLYMYHGSVMIKNDDIQGFCELLEMFLMPVPDDVAVSDSESGSEVEMKSESSSEEEEKIEENVYDVFVKNVRDVLSNLTEENVQMQSVTILNLANMIKQKIEVVVSLILECVAEPKPNVAPNLYVSLMKHICSQSREDSFYFCNELRWKTLRVFASGEKNLSNLPESLSGPSNESDNRNSLDKQVDLIQSIDSHCTSVRYQRLAHLIGHLFQSDLVRRIDINGLVENSPQYKDDLLGKKHTKKNCCNFQLPQVVDNICNDAWYRSVSPIANHLFWTRSQVVLGSDEPNRFKHLSKDVVFRKEPKRQRKKKLANLPSKPPQQPPKPLPQCSKK